MTNALKHINLVYPAAVPVPIGAADILVTMRELRTKYHTNRDIKVWAAWFLLKSLTRSCKIQLWRQQIEHLTFWLQVCERTMYRLLARMEELQLIRLEGGDIILASYRDAAEILGINYHGLTYVTYHPKTHEGNQIFQYVLRGEECRMAQEKQLNALWYYLHKNENLPVFSELCSLIAAKIPRTDSNKLKDDPAYFQDRLLQLQLESFKEGSAILEKVFKRRADINRSVQRMQRDHCYRAQSCVSYMKKRMATLGLIRIEKKWADSGQRRSRLQIVTSTGTRQAYKYGRRAKNTVLFLTDQIHFLYESTPQKAAEKRASNAAA
ncbi:MAG: hypothetical protein EOP50_00245 [Sphingobacteriales bacterium]|nr:MAG: hypothetical protein EOP50_00245 [Sphingobacteriales bacterium]